MKIKCLKCGDIVENDCAHHLIWCKCNSVAIDWVMGSKDTYRILGDDWEMIKEDESNE